MLVFMRDVQHGGKRHHEGITWDDVHDGMIYEGTFWWHH